MVYIDIIADDVQTVQFYKKLFKSQKYRIENELYLKDEISFISDKPVIIDLKHNGNLKLLNNISFGKNSYVILVLPVLEKFVKFPKNLSEVSFFTLVKPVNIKKFYSVLDECTKLIDKSNYIKSKESILLKTIDDSPLKIAIFDLDGKLQYANDSYAAANELKNLHGIKFEDLKNCRSEFGDIIYNVKIKDIYIVERNEQNRWFKSTFYLTKDNKNIVHFCIDSTEEKLYLESLKKSAQFFEKSSEGVIITDDKGVIVTTNNSFCKITGYTKDEAIGKPVSILNSGIHNKSFYEHMWSSLLHYEKWQGEIWNKRKNGEIYPEWLSITRLTNPETKEINYMAIFTDITSLKEADKKIHFYAHHDPLTGLLNKVQFENLLQQTLNSAIRNNKKFALLFVDLDYFKDVNDTAGHDVGDMVLKEVAGRFLSTLRKEDIVARIGGDEFNIIINNIQEESDVFLLADKLRENIKKPFNIKGKNFYLSLSIGISIFPMHGLKINELSKNADSAMYEVKKNGRDGALLYSKKFTDELMKKVSLLNDLKKAVKNEEFDIYFQLVIDINEQKVIGAEALIRWFHPKNGFISPEDFIAVAEHHGIIGEIGSIVLKNICTVLPRFLNKFGNDFILAFNVSSKEFAAKDFVENLIETVNDFNISPENLEIEITETYIMQNHSLAVEKMKTLRTAGFNIAIDDFGTGYSSLSYLKKFPVNKIKIDKSFVLDILKDKDDQDMVNAIITIAKIFNLEVQAEGVETLEHFKILKAHGVDIAQGYFYCKPVPLEDILLNNWNISYE